MYKICKNKNLCKKIGIIVCAMLLIRVVSQIPLPGVNMDYAKTAFSMEGLQFFHVLTGESLTKMSLFALSISPYITASIILQLLGILIPSIEEWEKEGKTGQEKMEQWNLILALGFSVFQSLFMAIGLGKQGLLHTYTWWSVLYVTIAWTAGAGILIWTGNWITKLQLGSGISYILLFNILSTLPSDLHTIYEVLMKHKNIPVQCVRGVIIAAVFSIILVICIILHLSVRKIPLTFSRKIQEFHVNQDLSIPLQVCGVMPIIFSGSLMSFPILISNFLPNVTWLRNVSMYLNEGNWFVWETPLYSFGVVLYIGLTIFFAFFYLDISYNSYEVANQLKSQGAIIPGIRSGKTTQEYLQGIIRKIGLFGTGVMLLLILSMTFLCNTFGIGALSIGGISIVICVSILLDFGKAVYSETRAVKYTAASKFLFGGKE